MPNSDSTKALRVAVLLDGNALPAWQFESLRLIDESASSKVVGVFSAPGSPAKRRRSLLYRLFCRLDAARRPVTPDAMAQVDPDKYVNLTSGVRNPEQYSDLNSIVSRLRESRADVLVSFASDSAVRDLAKFCPFGAVYFRHPYQQDADHEAAGSWEVLTREPWIAVSVARQCSDSSAPVTVYTTRSGINHFSLLRSRNQHLWKLAAVMPRVLRRLRSDSGESRPQPCANATIRSSVEVTRSMSSLSMAIPLLGYLWWRIGQKSYKKNWLEKWHLMVGRDQGLSDLRDFRTLKVPYGMFWADPFVIQRDGMYYLFFEEADVDTGTGHISVMEMSADGDVQPPRTIIKRPYHLSYPFVFEVDSQLYLIPESADNRSVEVYRCTAFPYDWKFDRNLMTGVAAYDVTLHQEENTWWMFAGTTEFDGASSWDELSLFYADHPLSNDWKPHPMNPIVSDVCNARPAGRLFRHEGELFRPAQDSSHRYGYGLNFNRVLALTKTDYREELVDTCKPDWDPAVQAIHTYNRCGSLTVVDAIRRARKK